jgi:hypothetical protein
LKKKFTKISGFFKRLPFIQGNSLQVNILLFLLFSGYFIVGFDLAKEIAKQKNEIAFFTATLQNSVQSDISAILILLETVPPVTYLLPDAADEVKPNDVELFHPGRSPPC